MSELSLKEKIEESAAALRDRIPAPPDYAIILGSGLGPLAERIEEPVRISYDEVPHFPETTVKGHAGTLVFGKLAGKTPTERNFSGATMR